MHAPVTFTMRESFTTGVTIYFFLLRTFFHLRCIFAVFQNMYDVFFSVFLKHICRNAYFCNGITILSVFHVDCLGFGLY